MAKFTLIEYRKQWPRVGAVLGMAVGGATALAAPRMKKTQVLAAANLIALVVHQYEEYQDPGYGPGQMNRVMGKLAPGIMHSDNPRNFPLNTHSAMCINTLIAYPVYVAPILFPKSKTLGMMPAFFGMSQAALHGILPKAALGDWYGPGFLSSALLHVPIGLAYLAALKDEGPLTRADYAKGLAASALFFALGLGLPNVAMRNKNSPYAFTEAQMGPYDSPELVEESAH